MKNEKKMIENLQGVLKIWTTMLTDDDYTNEDKLFAYSEAIKILSTLKDMGQD